MGIKFIRVIFLLLLSSIYTYGQHTQQVTLLFVGDLMQHQAQIDAAHRGDGSYDYRHCFSLVSERIRKADVAIGNLEVTLGGEPYRGYPQFSAPDEYLYALRDAGFDILATANNHSLDRHRRGLERTLVLIDSIYIVAMGTYRNAAIDQLSVLGEQIEVPVYKEEGDKNPIEIVQNAIKEAKAYKDTENL
ncbi:MAG: CapA family protein [Bacteroidaceae bacterium]|nr:CapA family protein [Bacteroidaceae bacterium]